MNSFRKSCGILLPLTSKAIAPRTLDSFGFYSTLQIWAIAIP